MLNDYTMTINLRCLRLIAGTYVVVQFYPWFKFYFPLFLTHYHTLLDQNIKHPRWIQL